MTLDKMVNDMSKIAEQVPDILRSKRVPNSIARYIITCVDPGYPVKSLGPEFQKIEVWYDANHVQQTGDNGFSQFFLVYNQSSGQFDDVAKEEVHESLPKGIIQLAFSKDTVVMGIPGDAYAFRDGKEGRGFAFGSPNTVPGSVAQDFLKALISYSSANVQFPEIVLMAHPDCGLFANNVGKFMYRKEAAPLLDSEPAPFVGCPYHQRETMEKGLGSVAVAQIFPHIRMTTVRPAYLERTPGIVKALQNSHR